MIRGSLPDMRWVSSVGCKTHRPWTWESAADLAWRRAAACPAN